MSILITGGAGYVGSQLSYLLTDNNYKHVIIDNISTGYKNLINPKAIFFKENFGNKNKLIKILKKNKIKCVMHLAASTLVPESMKEYEKYYTNNVLNLISLLEACKEAKVKYFIFSSTCAVFEEGQTKVNENSIKNSNNIYGKTKLYGEEIIKYLSKKYNFQYSILRYFNVIGADEKLRVGAIRNSGHLFMNIINSIFNKSFKINIYGNKFNTKDGTGVRDFIDVEDICNIHLLSYKKMLRSKKSYEINCGIGKGYSVNDIIKAYEKNINKRFKKIIKKPRPGDVAIITCSNGYLRKTLKYKFKYNLTQSINKYLNWQKKIRYNK
jgi:UDP-glucose 4-epimerase